jgi:citrate lyase subunit beta/citryl-CoA lyase
MGGAAADGGDLARALGFRWTPSAAETAYLRAKVLIDVRAAGVPNPMSGMVSTIDRADEVESFARQSRDLGYEGMMVIHPAHVPIANSAFTPTDEEIEEARAIVATLEEAAARGSAALVFQGRLIDTAMIETASRLLDDYARLERVDGGC